MSINLHFPSAQKTASLSLPGKSPPIRFCFLAAALRIRLRVSAGRGVSIVTTREGEYFRTSVQIFDIHFFLIRFFILE